MSRLVDGGWRCFAGIFSLPPAASGRAASLRSSRAERSSSAGDPRPASGVAEALRADRHERRARRRADPARAPRCCTPPMPITGISTRAATRRHLGERDRADRRSRQAAGAAAQPRLGAAGRRTDRPRAMRGASASARSVLISDTASAPPSCAASAQAATSAAFGVSFTISGLPVCGRTAPHDLLQLAGIGADVQARLHVRARHVQLDRRDLRARVARLAASSAISAAVEPITFVISGTGSVCQRRQILGQIARQALVRQADRVDQARRAPPTAAAADCPRGAAA